jgi:hypothetical protein
MYQGLFVYPEPLWLVVSETLLVLSWALLRPRTLAEVTELFISGSVLSRRLWRRFVIAAACYTLSLIIFLSFFWAHHSYRFAIALVFVLGLTLLPDTFFRQIASFLPRINFPKWRRHRWAREVLTIGLAVATALLIFWFVSPDAVAPR